MTSNEHRLGDLKIIQHISGDLSWESHFGFAEYRQGRCFIKGNILFLGRAKGGSIGFFKGDFIDSIKKLPLWEKTKYYCFVDDVYCCLTNNKATEDDIFRWHTVNNVANNQVSTVLPESESKLGIYQVTIKPNNLIHYKGYTREKQQVLGEGFLMDGILFLKKRKVINAETERKHFKAKLAKLTAWDKTIFYSFESSLKPCISGAEFIAEPKIAAKHAAHKYTYKLPQSEKQEDINKKLFSGAKLCVDVGVRLATIILRATLIILKQLSIMMLRAINVSRPVLVQLRDRLSEKVRRIVFKK